ncbi:DUF1636 domain-containing protein [Sulfitobacter sp. M57]|uniref:DUF1636 domain-containing protein n=1 Tax=unclassified Sulfitobacter TaxID=196795 RepID=UPI0023E20D0F|nr:MULTISPECIES: DUF1636 domain-containing protein [unclassified Sulfitobacter]MDF3415246.1 DUF1636 domain-containing protein [Sulfitobacter sp. KE5]MDF3422727.1 DUF1636 domain-containing protein [Sulfitobacter sp. KE43]MDF3433792.1 DUF1636 domain-containing protein [Sulfitobacter sp. KE42]MDF3459432.1 DUF1636 domain-containing protein [Sulfitobacter sp. S74]MDF3463331.1 DUF1636 domain-containing protein [Sulfitobacter sp. Ks18]
MKVSVCSSCAPEARFVDFLRDGLQGVEVESVECMSGCTRAQTVAFRESGKVAYLFGDLTRDDLAELQNFITLYTASEDGTFADARVLGSLRTKAIARIPG